MPKIETDTARAAREAEQREQTRVQRIKLHSVGLYTAGKALIDYVNKTANERELRLKDDSTLQGFFSHVAALEAAIKKADGVDHDKT